MHKSTILIVDDEKNILSAITTTLKTGDADYHIITTDNSRDAIQLMGKHQIELAILDIMLPELDGIELLRIIKEKKPDTVVIMMSGHASISAAVQSTKLGAYDFLEKPISRDKLLLTVQRALDFKRLENENIALREQIAEKYDLVGESRVMKELFRQIQIVGPSPSRVLIRGENGTGKELVARALHKSSLRKDKPFIKVNCAAIPHDLIESELFGHEKGAFTGATAMHHGKFELAHRGTIFLDEIGDMHLDTQAKVLRILQESEFHRVGGDEVIKVDVRVLAATNKDIEKEIRANRFREDLFFRLNVIPFRVPPLRNRIEDIPILVETFSSALSEEYGRARKTFDDSALNEFTNYNWPGNVRELRNLIERIFILCPEQTVTSDIMRNFLPRDSDQPADLSYAADGPLKDALADFEKNYILRKLKEYDYHVSETSKALKIERSHLYKKLRQFEIPLPRNGDEE